MFSNDLEWFRFQFIGALYGMVHDTLSGRI